MGLETSGIGGQVQPVSVQKVRRVLDYYGYRSYLASCSKTAAGVAIHLHGRDNSYLGREVAKALSMYRIAYTMGESTIICTGIRES